MRKLRAWLLRLWGLPQQKRQDQEFAEEIEAHLQMHIDDNLRAGMDPERARREALLKLGGIEMTTQSYREGNTLPFVETLWQDLRYTFRQLRKNPAFAVTAVLVLTLGIGATVGIFAFADAALIKPLPYRDPRVCSSSSEARPSVHVFISRFLTTTISRSSTRSSPRSKSTTPTASC